MGSITSLVDGSTHHYNELVTVTYDSGTFDFGNGAGQIATLVFEQNGIPKATRSTQPTAAPATYSQSWALPASGATAIIRVHAKNLMGMVLETVEVTLNLEAQPAATCAGATDQAMDALTLNGNIVGIPAGGSARFRYGTTNGGPYPDTIPASPQAVGPTSAAVTGLTAGTVYYYVLEILDASSTVVATSPQCSGQTLREAGQDGPACPVPPYVDECPPKQVYNVGGTQYIAFEFCDSGNQQTVIAVFAICDGKPSGTPTYYDLEGLPYAPTGDVGKCSDAPDYEIMCDHGATPPARMIALWDATATPPALKYFQAAADGSLTAYTPVGPVGSCSSTDIEETSTCYVATVDGALGSGYSQGDILTQILFWDTSATPPVLLSTAWRNQSTNALLTAAPVFSELAPCDGVPPRDCIPSSNVSVNRTDCAGGPVPPAVLADLSPLSVNIDDSDLDGVCTDATSIAPEFFPAPFPVNEPVRTANSGMTLFDGALLTAANAIDVPGTGWLRLTNNNNSQRGGAIVQAPFPSTTGIEFEYTYAVYGKTAADGADGHSFMLLDGNLPMPATMGAPGGALGYANINANPGIAGGVICIGLDEFGNFSNPGAGVTTTGPGFLPQHLTIRGAGNGTSGYPWLTSIDLQAVTGQTIDGHPRATPVKVRGSLIPNGGQMTLNLFLDFGAGYVQVVNNLLINQALPTQLRFGFSASTGGYNNYHEIRDIIAAPPSRRHWRAITPTFDDPPACATALEGSVNVTYTLTSDTQTQQGGDNDNEHFIGWALEDPVGTYTWLAQKWIRSAPTEVGVERTITLATGTLTPAQRSQLRLVLGAETVDLHGSYGIRYSLVETNLIAVGCPAETIKTMPISAPCPIPVTIVQTGSGSGVAATVNTVEVEVVCSDIGQIFRREVRDTSGTPKVDFMGQDGQAVSPTTWAPGPCTDCECQRLIQPVCLRDSVTGDTRTGSVIYSFTSAGLVDTTSLVDHAGAVITPTATEVVTLGGCESPNYEYIPLCDTVTTAETPPASPVTVVAPDIQDAEQKTNGGGVVVVNDDDIQFGLDAGNNDKIGAVRFTLNVPQGATITAASIQFTCQDASSNPSNLTIQAEAADNAAPFVATVNSLALRPKSAASVNWSPAAWVAGAAGIAQKTPDLSSVVQEIVNRAGWAANNALAIYIDGTGMRDAVGLATNAAQAPVLTVTYTMGAAGSPETTTTKRFYRKVLDGITIGDYWLDPADGLWKPYTVQGSVDSCADDKHRDAEVATLCDDNGSFFRHIVYGDNGAVVQVFDTELDGITAYVPVGAVTTCAATDACDGEPATPGTGTICTVTLESQRIYDDPSDPDLMFMVTQAGNVQTVDIHFTTNPNGGKLDNSARTFVRNVNNCLLAGNIVVLTLNSSPTTTDPVSFVLGGPSLQGTPTFVDGVIDEYNSPINLNVIDDRTGPFCPEIAAYYDQTTIPAALLGQDIAIDRISYTCYSYTEMADPGSAGTDTVRALVVKVCNLSEQDQFEVVCLEDASGTRFSRVIRIDPVTGVAEVVGDYEPSFGSTYTPVGAVIGCGTPIENEGDALILCDDNGSFLRHFIRDRLGDIISVLDTDLSGVIAYTTVGTIKTCQPEGKPCLTCRS